MGHRSIARRLCAAVATATLLTLCGSAVAAGAAPSQVPSDGTLLPPADGDDVSIVPTDRQQPSGPDAERPPSDPRRHDERGPAGPEAALLLVLAMGITAVAVARLARMLYVWRSPTSLAAAGFGPAAPPATSFSLLVPARRSGRLLGATLDHLAALDHPRFEILAIVPYEDAGARGAALAAVMRHPGKVHLVVDKSYRKARAAGLNAALAEAHGEIVGVVEPGDRVHPRLLRHVDSCFAEPDVAAVQGGIQLTAATRRWFGTRNVVERYFWSRSRLHLHATQHFTPLEDSTAFVRSDVLRSSGGWDESCAAEGCELGVRLSTQGHRIVVAYSPELATQKPAVASNAALLAERTQWIGGFVRALRLGHWRRLPGRAQRMRAALMLARPLVDALAGLAVPVAAVAAITLNLRPAYVLLLLLPTVPALVAIGVEMVALSELGRIHDRPRRHRDQFWLVVSVLPYQLLAAVAAGRVLLGEIRPVRHGLPIPTARPERPNRGRDHLQSLDELDEVDLTAPHVVDDPARPVLPARLALPAASGDR